MRIPRAFKLTAHGSVQGDIAPQLAEGRFPDKDKDQRRLSLHPLETTD